MWHHNPWRKKQKTKQKTHNAGNHAQTCDSGNKKRVQNLQLLPPSGPRHCKCFHTTPSEPAVCSPTVTRVFSHRLHPVTPQSMIRGAQVSRHLTFTAAKDIWVRRGGERSQPSRIEIGKKKKCGPASEEYIFEKEAFVSAALGEQEEDNFLAAQCHQIAAIQHIDCNRYLLRWKK